MKLALKRLTSSDLTFFEWQFSNRPAGNQKAINLNANVFIDVLYPSLPDIANEQGGRFPLDLFLYGPGLTEELNLQRKIVKGASYKNWRLNGEFIHNPPEDPDRFNVLVPNDLALFSFRGTPVPHTANVYLISSSLPVDKAVHAELSRMFVNERDSMVKLVEQELDQLIQKVYLAENHTLNDFLLLDALEDAAFNGIEGVKRLRTRASQTYRSHQALKRARDEANRVGRNGEEIINGYLGEQQLTGQVIEFKWVSDDNAVSPHDFEIETVEGTILVDVKTTKGDFDNIVHISYNELLQMRDSGAYHIYRVYRVTEEGAKLRVSQPMREFAERVLRVLEQLPGGVRPDSMSVSPDILKFDDVVMVDIREDI